MGRAAAGPSGVGLLSDSRHRLPGLLMPVSVTSRCPRPSLVVAPADAFSHPPLPPAVVFPPPVAAFAAGPALRVGNNEMGRTPCPRLCGPPGIRR